MDAKVPGYAYIFPERKRKAERSVHQKVFCIMICYPSSTFVSNFRHNTAKTPATNCLRDWGTNGERDKFHVPATMQMSVPRDPYLFNLRPFFMGTKILLQFPSPCWASLKFAYVYIVGKGDAGKSERRKSAAKNGKPTQDLISFPSRLVRSVRQNSVKISANYPQKSTSRRKDESSGSKRFLPNLFPLLTQYNATHVLYLGKGCNTFALSYKKIICQW